MSLVYKFGYPPHFVLNFECPLIAVNPHDSASVDFAVDLAAMYPYFGIAKGVFTVGYVADLHFFTHVCLVHLLHDLGIHGSQLMCTT